MNSNAFPRALQVEATVWPSLGALLHESDK